MVNSTKSVPETVTVLSVTLLSGAGVTVAVLSAVSMGASKTSSAVARVGTLESAKGFSATSTDEFAARESVCPSPVVRRIDASAELVPAAQAKSLPEFCGLTDGWLGAADRVATCC